MMTKINLGSWLRGATERLAGSSDAPHVESTAIAAFVLEHPREWLVAHPETELFDDQISIMEACLNRIVNGEPLAYITGRRSFYGLDFQVNPGVLVPRPETELLVECALNWLADHPDRRKVADIGTGSGIIAISTAKNCPDAQILATDISNNALETARGNAIDLGVSDRIRFQQTNLLGGIDERFDLILANLPYIPTTGLEGLPVARHEPHLALDGGADGLVLIRKLVSQIPQIALPGACMILEIQYNQGDQMLHIVNQLPGTPRFSLLKDLAGLPRIVKIQL